MNRDRAKMDYRRALELSHGAPTCAFAWRPFTWTTPKSPRPNLQLEPLRKTHPDQVDIQTAWARCCS